MNSTTTEQQGKGFYICQVKNSDLAIFSYYVESQKEAVIIDPVFDTKVYQQIIKKRGATLKNIVMTHYHADFISGHLEFQVPIVMGQQSPKNINNYKINQLKDGQTLKLGSIKLISIHTPGHTIQSTTYLLKDSQQKNICIFTGDTLFLGEVGRPDLANGGDFDKVQMAGMLYQSIQKLKKLQNELRIYPAHGSGSACSGKKIQQGNFCTIGRQKQKNPFLTYQGKNQFISNVLQGNDQPPKYYSHDAKLNQKGPSPYAQKFNKVNNPLNAQQFYKLEKGCKIFDTRADTNQGGLIKGSYWTNTKGTITSWIPMVASPEDQLSIVVDEGKSDEILNRFLRLGFFNIKGYNNFKVSQYPGQREQMKIVNGKQALQIKGRTHLDVRNPDQWKKTGIIEGAIGIPLKQLKNRTKQVEGIENLVINCKSGMRARFAQSILAKNGIKSIVMAQKVQQLDKIGHKMVPYFEEEQKKE